MPGVERVPTSLRTAPWTLVAASLGFGAMLIPVGIAVAVAAPALRLRPTAGT